MFGPRLAILGSSRCPEDSKLWRVASELGCRAAGRGMLLVTGGTGGAASAAGRAAKQAGGLVVGILPAEAAASEEAFLDVLALTIPVQTGLVPKARNVVLISSCDAAVAVGGAYGTLNEMTIAIAHRVPLVVIEGYGGAADLIRVIIKELGNADTVAFARTPSEALDRVEELLRQRAG